ncbi:hypothetical protein HY491_02920 [Candidatus Woesearchaeota archaeon]|nr:hypothetical protein [Candidatus Woesearchaeota archaeon]
MNNRAISPLVATILLLAFAIALGSVVMAWGKGLIEKAGTAEQPSQDADTAFSLLQKCVDAKAITPQESGEIATLFCRP